MWVKSWSLRLVAGPAGFALRHSEALLILEIRLLLAAVQRGKEDKNIKFLALLLLHGNPPVPGYIPARGPCSETCLGIASLREQPESRTDATRVGGGPPKSQGPEVTGEAH